MTRPLPKPFPYETLAHLPRRSILISRRLRSWLTWLASQTPSLRATCQDWLAHDNTLGIELGTPTFVSEHNNTGGWGLWITSETHHALLVLDTDVALALVDALLHDDSAVRPTSRPLTPLEHGLLVSMLTQAVALIGQHLHCTLQCHLSPPDTAPLLERLDARAGLITIPIELTLGTLSGFAHVLMPTTQLESVSAPPTTQQHDLRNLKLDVHIELLRLTLPLRAVKALEPGALLMGPTVTAWRTQPLRLLCSGRPVWRCRIDAEDRLILTEAVEHTTTHSANNNLPNIQSRGASVDNDNKTPLPEHMMDLPVEIVFEAGRMTLALRELAALSPGEVLTPGGPLQRPIDLTVGGQKIARGELVDVEGHLGVRILSTTLDDLP